MPLTAVWDESLRLLCHLIPVFKPGTFPKTKAKREGGKDHKTTRIQTEHTPSVHNMHAGRGIWFPLHTRVDCPLARLSFWKKVGTLALDRKSHPNRGSIQEPGEQTPPQTSVHPPSYHTRIFFRILKPR